MSGQISDFEKFRRAANYLTVAQIFLQDNFLLERPLTFEDVKPRLLGHWGSGPGVNLAYAHLNSMIKKYCDEKGYTYLDYFSAMNDGKNGMKAEYTTDMVHCTVKGYEVMESMVQPAIQKALKAKK